jgi:dihydrofolate reductase
MGSLVVSEFISIDGVIEDPGGAEGSAHGGWAFQFDRGDGDGFKFTELMAADAQLLGRRTYEGFAKAWPTMTDMGEFGDKMNAMPKYVVSATLESADWTNSTVIGGNLAYEVATLKQQFEGDILVAGSAQLVQGLLALGLVDELRLMVFPVLLGGGKRLFADDAERAALSIVEAKHTGDVVLLTLRPAAA